MNMRTIVYLLGIFLIFACHNRVKFEESTNESEIDIPKSELEMTCFWLYENNEYSESLKCLNSLIILDSANGDYFFKRGNCYSAIGKLDRSNLDFLSSAKLNHRPSDSYFNIGLNYTRLLNDSAALVYFQRAQELDPDDDDIAYQIKMAKMRTRYGVKIY